MRSTLPLSPLAPKSGLHPERIDLRHRSYPTGTLRVNPATRTKVGGANARKPQARQSEFSTSCSLPWRGVEGASGQLRVRDFNYFLDEAEGVSLGHP